MQKNRYDNQYTLITGENENVGSSSDLKDFCILLGWILLVIIIFLASFQFIANFFIDRMSIDDQLKFEKIFSYTKMQTEVPEKYKNKVNDLYQIEKKIIPLDPKIKHKQNFPIYVLTNKEINAVIHPDGTIAVTSGLLDENFNEQELAFIIAHEIGHYSNKDHLKAVSKQLAVITLCMLSGNSDSMRTVVNSTTGIDTLHHSKRQERNADLYAGKMLIKIYGTNQAGINVMKKVQDKDKLPEFIQYVSDHPRTSTRINLLENQQKKL